MLYHREALDVGGVIHPPVGAVLGEKGVIPARHGHAKETHRVGLFERCPRPSRLSVNRPPYDSLHVAEDTPMPTADSNAQGLDFSIRPARSRKKRSFFKRA